ncbi:hypothetical protein EON67_03690 [archaeon]|nr:MAG: hypothetical protein EON67_03690 [archaeon]
MGVCAWEDACLLCVFASMRHIHACPAFRRTTGGNHCAWCASVCVCVCVCGVRVRTRAGLLLLLFERMQKLLSVLDSASALTAAFATGEPGIIMEAGKDHADINRMLLVRLAHAS